MALYFITDLYLSFLSSNKYYDRKYSFQIGVFYGKIGQRFSITLKQRLYMRSLTQIGLKVWMLSALFFTIYPNQVQAQITITNDPMICTEYLLFAHPVTHDIQTVCVKWYMKNSGDTGSLDKEGVFSWAKWHGYCYVGRVFSYEAKESWFNYWYFGAGAGKAGCHSTFYNDTKGSRHEVTPIMNGGGKGKGWWHTWVDVAANIDLTKAILVQTPDHVVIKGLPGELEAIEVPHKKQLVLNPKSVLVVDAGQYPVVAGAVSLGRIHTFAEPVLQCGDGGCCTSNPAFKAMIKEDIFQLKQNDGTCTVAQYARPDDELEDDFHVMEIVIEDILLGIVNPVGEEINVCPAGEEIGDGIVCPAGVEIGDGIVCPVGDVIFDGIVCPAGETIDNVIEIIIEDVLIGKTARQSEKETRNPLMDSAYPNPFNPSTSLSYTLPEAAQVSLIVYNMQGKEVAKLLNGTYQTAGQHTVQFNASQLPSGTYIYRLSAGHYTTTKRIQLVK